MQAKRSENTISSRRRIVHERDARDAVGEAQCGLERFGEAQPDVVLDLEAIDDRIDAMLLAQVERRRLVEFVDLAVDARANEALRHQVRHQLHVLALAVGDDRRQQHQRRAFRQREHLVDHLADRLRLEVGVVVRAARDAGARDTAGAGSRRSR